MKVSEKLSRRVIIALKHCGLVANLPKLPNLQVGPISMGITRNILRQIRAIFANVLKMDLAALLAKAKLNVTVIMLVLLYDKMRFRFMIRYVDEKRLSFLWSSFV